MLAIEKLLSGFDVRVAAFEVCNLRAGWRLDLEPPDELALHYVLDGRGSLHVCDGESMPLGPATVVVVPPGHKRTFVAGRANGKEPRPVSSGDGCCAPLTQGLVRRNTGNGQPGLVMACGGIGATYGDGTGVFDRLHDPVI